ncbi:SDR family NAD(P)-dependent oxidoreductase [Streptomyces sp. NPDC053560]|uniref:SDR family NAD(P)-dependent oxidoreductase n=1 Tax=Streptomyces sp. NPDC053560 TaxID=3365711 RepID=UPI0037D12901
MSDPLPLDGRVVALTGAGRGLGLRTTRTLLERGAHVIANVRTPTDELTALGDAHGGRLHVCRGDIGEESTAEEIVRCAAGLGRLDALVHNAGIAKDQPLVRMPAEDWDAVQRVNLRGAFLATKHALRPMMRARSGRLVYVSSVVAQTGNAGQASYAASKAALHGLSLSVAQEYARYGIRSVVVSPGLLDTGLAGALPEKVFEQKAARSLTGVVPAERVAAAIAYLLHPDSADINATVLRIDGGIAY